MARQHRKREDEMIRKLKEKEEVNMDDVIDVPDFDNSELIEENSLSIIVRILNKDAIKTDGIISALPKN